MTDELQNSWMTCTTPNGGVELAEAYFDGQAFSPHRHDTYAIGMTTAGVQSFNYRGQGHNALPGQALCFIQMSSMTVGPERIADMGTGSSTWRRT